MKLAMAEEEYSFASNLSPSLLCNLYLSSASSASLWGAPTPSSAPSALSRVSSAIVVRRFCQERSPSRKDEEKKQKNPYSGDWKIGITLQEHLLTKPIFYEHMFPSWKISSSKSLDFHTPHEVTVRAMSVLRRKTGTRLRVDVLQRNR